MMDDLLRAITEAVRDAVYVATVLILLFAVVGTAVLAVMLAYVLRGV